MSLARVFEAGQAYVALSRAKSLDTLRILDFDPKQVWANPDVLEFYRKFCRKLYLMEAVPLGRPRVQQQLRPGLKLRSWNSDTKDKV
jgi:ATP-dependent DNA helicase PIF1